MGRDELLAMLGLGDMPAATTSDDLLAPASAGAGGEASNPNAMRTDEWTERRGHDIANGTMLDALDLADMHAACFDPEPELLPACANPRKREFIEQLMATPEYRSLRTSTMLDEAASAVAAATLGKRFAALEEDDHREGRKPEPAKPGRKGPDEGTRAEMRAVRAAGAALLEAAAEVEVLEAARTACGMGKGARGGHHDPARTAALFRRVRSSRSLARIMELAGRFRLVAQSKQRRKQVHGMDDLVGVTTGGEIARLLASELARLALDETELDTLRRISERQALCRDHRSVEPVGKGPIIVSVDESGSMAGDKVHTAKALALALAWVARSQGRWCGLVAFSGDTGHRLLALPPGGWDESGLLDWLERFESGGSDLDVPVREMPEFYRQLGAPAGVTDVIFVTDAICRIPPAIKESFLAWKREVKARLVTLVIESEPGDLAAISDEVHSVPCLDPGGEGVGKVLSL